MVAQLLVQWMLMELKQLLGPRSDPEIDPKEKDSYFHL
jgi:hypothetical protein